MPAKSLIDDMLSLGGGLLSGLAEARHEIRAQMRARVDGVLRDCDFVTREEFDAAFAMLAAARQAQEDLTARLGRLEAKAGPGVTAKPAKSTRSSRSAASPRRRG